MAGNANGSVASALGSTDVGPMVTVPASSHNPLSVAVPATGTNVPSLGNRDWTVAR